MYGHKRVSERRYDALTRVGWDQLELRLATWYRGQGYEVEQTGTAASGSKYDGGIDLKLRRPGEYVLVQVKHWNAYKVPHNDVHQLLGLMVNEGATRAILITSGEFTKAAIEAATRHGHVRLIDGDELRAMLGPLPEPMATGDQPMSRVRQAVGEYVPVVGARLLRATEDRIRGGRGMKRVQQSLAAVLLLKLGSFALFVWFVVSMANHFTHQLTRLTRPHVVVQPATSPPVLTPPMSGRVPVTAAPAPAPHPAYHEPTAAEVREMQKKADEAMKVIKDSTPEM